MTSQTIPTHYVNAAFSLFNFRPAPASPVLGGVCIAPLDSKQLLAARLIAPLYLVLVLVGIVCVARLVQRFRRRRAGKESAWRPEEDGSERALLDEAVDDNDVNIDDLRKDDDDNDSSGVQSQVLSSSASQVGRSNMQIKVAREANELPFLDWLRTARAAIALVLFSFSAVLSVTLGSLHCRDISGKRYLAADVRLACDEMGFWQTLAMFVFAPYLLLAIVLAVVSVWWSLRRRMRRGHSHATLVFGVLFDGYRDKWTARYWDAWVLLRRVLIGIFASVVGWQSGTFLVIFIGLLTTGAVEPFRRRVENRLDTLCNVMLTYNFVYFRFSRQFDSSLVDLLLLGGPVLVVLLSLARNTLAKLAVFVRHRARQWLRKEE